MLTIETKAGELEFEDDSITASDDDVSDMAKAMFDIKEGEDTIRTVFEKMWNGKAEGVDELT